MAFAFSFSALDVEIKDQYENPLSVYVVHWRYSASDDDDPPHVASMIGTTGVRWEPDDPAFIPYAELTQATIQSWVESDLGEDRLASMQSSLLAEIQEAVEPTHETMRGNELPWNEDSS